VDHGRQFFHACVGEVHLPYMVVNEFDFPAVLIRIALGEGKLGRASAGLVEAPGLRVRGGDHAHRDCGTAALSTVF
jgi:hypothetical protein